MVQDIGTTQKNIECKPGQIILLVKVRGENLFKIPGLIINGFQHLDKLCMRIPFQDAENRFKIMLRILRIIHVFDHIRQTEAEVSGLVHLTVR